MIGCLDSKKKYFFISKLRKNTKKGLKMTFYSNKSQNFLDDPRWVSYISKWAPNYDWFHGKGLILRTLENSSRGAAKTWKIGEKGKKICSCRDSYPHLLKNSNSESSALPTDPKRQIEICAKHFQPNSK